MHGLTRALLANMVKGVTQGFQKCLEIVGVGFPGRSSRVTSLILQVGFRHPVEVVPPHGITLWWSRRDSIIDRGGIDKELVGEVAAKIRAVRKPEPYKGKGIAMQGEAIRRKAGKAGGRIMSSEGRTKDIGEQRQRAASPVRNGCMARRSARA